MIDADSAKELALALKAGLLSAFGGAVGYLANVVNKGEKFSWFAYAVFVSTAFFVGQVLGSWLPNDMPGRDGVLMISGTAAYPALVAMQSRVLAVIERLK